MGLKLNYFVLWEQVLKNSCSFITIGIHRGYVHLISVDLFTEQCSNVKTRRLCTEFEILGSAPQTYCSIMNCSSPLCDCDMPDECFISSPYLMCDKPPISSRGIIFSADWLCILGEFKNGECQRMKINSTT